MLVLTLFLDIQGLGIAGRVAGSGAQRGCSCPGHGHCVSQQPWGKVLLQNKHRALLPAAGKS